MISPGVSRGRAVSDRDTIKWPERIAEIEAQLPAAMANYEKARAEQQRAEQARPAPRPRPAARPTQR